jgi:hypothetical protein
MKQIVIMPGGFHPFHAGHYALYKSAIEAFPDADVYVAATNDQSERPFPFGIKEKLAKLAGVAPGRFVQVKSPFQAKEITQSYDPNSDVLIFVRSEKDKNESPKPGGTKKDGSPAYFQPYTGKDMQPFSKHAYFAYLPTVTFGPGIQSATQIRNAWPTLDDRRKTAMVMSLYPATQKNPKLAQNVVQLLDVGMGSQQAVAEGQNMPDANGNYKFHMFAYLRNGDIKEFNVIANGDRNAKILAKKKLIEKGYNNIYSIDIQGMSPVHGPVNYAIDRRLKLEQRGAATGSDGWIGNPAKWKEAVLQAHGPDVAFKNYSHPGQPGKRSIHAWDSNGKIVGVYQRHNKMGMVQPNIQGVSEGLSKRDQQDVAAIKAAIERLQAQLSHPNADRDAIQQSIAHEKKRLALYGVAEGSLNEFAVDGFGDSGDKRSKLLASVGRLLDGGNKVDWQVPGQMGHVTRVQNDGITMKRWKMPRSRMSFFLPMNDDSRDSRYTIKMVAPKHYAVVSAEQGVAEGFGLPMPSTYGQETEPLKSHGARRIIAMTNEDSNMSESTDYLEEK